MDNVTFVRGSQGPQFWIQEPSQIPQPRMPRTKALSSLSFGPIRIQGRRNSSPPLSRNDSILWSGRTYVVEPELSMNTSVTRISPQGG